MGSCQGADAGTRFVGRFQFSMFLRALSPTRFHLQPPLIAQTTALEGTRAPGRIRTGRTTSRRVTPDTSRNSTATATASPANPNLSSSRMMTFGSLSHQDSPSYS